MGHLKARATAFASVARGEGIAAQGLKDWGLENPEPGRKSVTEFRGVVGALRRAAEVSGRNTDSERAEVRADVAVARVDAENIALLEGQKVVGKAAPLEVTIGELNPVVIAELMRSLS